MSRHRPTGRPRGRPPYPGLLTPAEQRVLEQLRADDELTNAEIGVRLGLSSDTVKTHVGNMLSKLYLEDRRQLAAWQPPAEAAPVGRSPWWGGFGGFFGRIPGVASLPSVAPGVAVALVVAATAGALIWVVGRTGSAPDPTPVAAVVTATATPSSTPSVVTTGTPTVKTHIASMLSKLYLSDRHQLAAWQPEPEPVGAGRRWYAGLLALPKTAAAALPGPTAIAGGTLAPLVAAVAGALVFVAVKSRGAGRIGCHRHHDGRVRLPTPGTSATPAVTTTPTPPATPTITPTAVTSPTTPPAAGDIPYYPAGTRSGIAAVDRVIADVEAGILVRHPGYARRTRMALHWPGNTGPECPAETAPGTSVAAAFIEHCQQGFVRRDEVPQVLRPFAGQGRGVYNVFASTSNSDAGLVGTGGYRLVFAVVEADDDVRREFDRFGLTEKIGEGRYFARLDDAIDAFHAA